MQQSFSKNKLSFYFRFKGFLVHTVLTSKISSTGFPFLLFVSIAFLKNGNKYLTLTRVDENKSILKGIQEYGIK